APGNQNGLAHRLVGVPFGCWDGCAPEERPPVPPSSAVAYIFRPPVIRRARPRSQASGAGHGSCIPLPFETLTPVFLTWGSPWREWRRHGSGLRAEATVWRRGDPWPDGSRGAPPGLLSGREFRRAGRVVPATLTRSVHAHRSYWRGLRRSGFGRVLL